MALTVQEIARRLGGRCAGDGGAEIRRVAGVAQAAPGELGRERPVGELGAGGVAGGIPGDQADARGDVGVVQQREEGHTKRRGDGRRARAERHAVMVVEAVFENFELKRANEILRKASAFFAQAELDRRGK